MLGNFSCFCCHLLSFLKIVSTYNIFLYQKNNNLTMPYYLESPFVGNPEDRFCHVEANVMYMDSSSSGGVSCLNYISFLYFSSFCR